MPLESTITKGIVKALRAVPGVWVMKIHGGAFQQAGIPDLIGLVPYYAYPPWPVHSDPPLLLVAQFFAIEVKRPGGRLTVLQDRNLQRLRALGALTGVAHSAEEAFEILGLKFPE